MNRVLVLMPDGWLTALAALGSAISCSLTLCCRAPSFVAFSGQLLTRQLVDDLQLGFSVVLISFWQLTSEYLLQRSLVAGLAA